MNNSQMNFDPMTGQPINTQNNINPLVTEQPQPQVIPVVEPIKPAEQLNDLQIQNVQTIPQVESPINTQQQLQNIATVEQSTQDFINNIQATNTEKAEKKNDGPNVIFIIILFVIIFAAILFLFPYLIKTL